MRTHAMVRSRSLFPILACFVVMFSACGPIMRPTSTPAPPPPTSTPVPPTRTPISPTPAEALPTRTPVPPTSTAVPPTPRATPTRVPVPTLTVEEQLAQRLHEPWAAKDWEEVISLIEQILTINPDYDDMTEKLYAAHVNYGQKLAAEGRVKEAKEEFTHALDVKPSGGEAIAGLQALAGETPRPILPTSTPPPPTPIPPTPTPQEIAVAPAPPAPPIPTPPWFVDVSVLPAVPRTPVLWRAPRCTVGAEGLNLRAGPGTAYRVLTVLDRGELVYPIARNPESDWVAVWARLNLLCIKEDPQPTCPNGWVHADFIDCNVAIDSLAIVTSVTQPPTPTPPEIAGEPVPPLPTTQTVRYYWQLVNNGQYDIAWTLLSPSFKQQNHGNSYNDYLQGYQAMKLCGVEASDVMLTQESDSSAVVFAHLTYRMGSGCSTSEYNFDFFLVRDATYKIWLIDRVMQR